jgi:hypothetical protein
MTIVAVIALPFVLAYQAWSYYVFRRRVSPSDFSGTPALPRRGGGRPGAAALAGTGSAAAMSAADPEPPGAGGHQAGRPRAGQRQPDDQRRTGQEDDDSQRQAGREGEATGTPTTDAAGPRAPRHRWHLPGKGGGSGD